MQLGENENSVTIDFQALLQETQSTVQEYVDLQASQTQAQQFEGLPELSSLVITPRFSRAVLKRCAAQHYEAVIVACFP